MLRDERAMVATVEGEKGGGLPGEMEKWGTSGLVVWVVWVMDDGQGFCKPFLDFSHDVSLVCEPEETPVNWGIFRLLVNVAGSNFDSRARYFQVQPIEEVHLQCNFNSPILAMLLVAHCACRASPGNAPKASQASQASRFSHSSHFSRQLLALRAWRQSPSGLEFFLSGSASSWIVIHMARIAAFAYQLLVTRASGCRRLRYTYIGPIALVDPIDGTIYLPLIHCLHHLTFMSHKHTDDDQVLYNCPNRDKSRLVGVKEHVSDPVDCHEHLPKTLMTSPSPRPSAVLVCKVPALSKSEVVCSMQEGFRNMPTTRVLACHVWARRLHLPSIGGAHMQVLH